MYKIYKIISKLDANTVYIGSTKKELCDRLKGHKNDAKCFKGKHKKHDWIIKNYDNLDIIEIDAKDNREEALCREEVEILKHREQGYNVLNTLLVAPKKFNPLNDQHITYEQQYRKCNKGACRTCIDGQGHGPYWYAFWREGSKLKSAYIGKERTA
jgi:predicted GIY-YIG superfamily endonuclease